MADGPQPVDIAQQLFARGAFNQNSGGGGGGTGAVCGILKDADVFAGLSLKGPAQTLTHRGVCPNGSGGGPLGRLLNIDPQGILAQCGDAFLKNICNGVQSASPDQVYGHGLDSGSFVARIEGAHIAPSARHSEWDIS